MHKHCIARAGENKFAHKCLFDHLRLAALVDRVCYNPPSSAMRLRLLPRMNIAAVRSCDAIATSANAGLVGNANPNFWRFAGKKNADGAVHSAAGSKLLEACQTTALVDGVRCAPGSVIVTPAFDLHAEYVIHCVAPDGLYGAGLQKWWGRRQWSGNQSADGVYLEEACPAGEADALLQRTYGGILTAASAHAVDAVALPAVGAGVLGFAAGRSAKMAMRACAAHALERADDPDRLERVDVALLDDEAFRAWGRVARALLGEPQSVAAETGVEVYDIRRLLESQAKTRSARSTSSSATAEDLK